jgi:hypothetical protein
MKKILLVTIIALMASSFTYAGGLNWYSWNEGYELAKKENKPMLLFLYLSWCDQSKRMEKVTLMNEEVVALINQGYVPVKIDFDVIIKGKDTYNKDGKELTGMELLKSLVPPGPVGAPASIIFTVGSETKVLEMGLKDPEEMKKFLTDNMKK